MMNNRIFINSNNNSNNNNNSTNNSNTNQSSRNNSNEMDEGNNNMRNSINNPNLRRESISMSTGSPTTTTNRDESDDEEYNKNFPLHHTNTSISRGNSIYSRNSPTSVFTIRGGDSSSSCCDEQQADDYDDSSSSIGHQDRNDTEEDATTCDEYDYGTRSKMIWNRQSITSKKSSRKNVEKDFALPLWQLQQHEQQTNATANPQSPPSDDPIEQQLYMNPKTTATVDSPTSDTSRRHSFMSNSSLQYEQQYQQQYQKCNTFKANNIPLLLIAFVLVGIIAVFTSEFNASNATDQIINLESNNNAIDTKITTYEKDIQLLQHEISSMDLMIQKEQEKQQSTNNRHNNNVNHNIIHEQLIQQRQLNEINLLQNKLQIDAKQAIDLKHQVQIMSKADIISKYGIGPHRIEMELIFPDLSHLNAISSTKSRRVFTGNNAHNNNNNEDGGPTKFIIELASIDLMPHSIHTFLEMAHYGLLDGCSFILNALHVVKAAPLPYDGSSAADKAKAFIQHGLESVAFKEYTNLYQHKQYTIGFAADGSPSFYINTEDNSEIHVGDPCFGKVIEGFNTIHRLESNPTRNGIWFEKRIGIKKATIL